MSRIILLAAIAFPFVLAPVSGQEIEIEIAPSIRIKSAQLQLIVDVEVAGRDAGVVKSVQFKEGDQVKRGDALVELDGELENASVNSAISELDVAKEEANNDIDLRYAKVSQEVSDRVYQRSLNATKAYAKSVSKTELEKLKLEVQRATLSGEQAQRTAIINQLNVELKKSQLEAALVRQRGRKVLSPVDGLVVEVFHQVGEAVQAGEAVARIIDLEKLRVVCRCKVKDALPGEIGKKAIFRCDDRAIDARITFVSPEIDPDIQDFVVWAEIDNSKNLLMPGMIGTIDLQLLNIDE